MTRLLLALALAGCADPDAPAKCEDLVLAICENGEVACSPSLDAEDCGQIMDDGGVNCDEAVDVSDTYEACLEEVEASDECLLMHALPDGCTGAILYLE